MANQLNKMWRLLATGTSFFLFGLGGFLLSAAVFPVVHVVSLNREKAQRRCRHLVHKSFALFVWVMRSLGVLTDSYEGIEGLAGESRFIVANHPSLIDVVLLIARVPGAYCVVKGEAWKNPVMFGVMRATGFIANSDGQSLVDACAHHLKAGQTLVMFPEGTRTMPGQKMCFQRGAAIIAAKAGVPFTPVYISCKPSTLIKGVPWYCIPDKRPHFSLVAGPSFNLPFDGDQRDLTPRMARRSTKALQEHFEAACNELYGEYYGRTETRSASVGCYHT